MSNRTEPLPPAEREALENNIIRIRRIRSEIDAAAAPLRALVEPFQKLDAALDDEIETLLARADVEIVGECEGCEALLFSGDLGHRGEDGINLCHDHSPDWDDIKRQWDEGREETDDGDRAAFMAAYDAHIAAGGKPSDKVAFPL